MIPDAINGCLTRTSPLRRVFPDGFVPLRQPVPTAAVLGEGPGASREQVYLVDLWKCTPEQRMGMARIAAEVTGADVHEVLHEMDKTADMPVRLHHFAGVSFPGRLLA